MRKIFLWFYCLPIADAVLLILLATGSFLLLRRKYGRTPYWRIGRVLLFLSWICVILLATLGQRTESISPAEPILMPFASYYTAFNGGSRELYRTNFMNVALFYPAGLLGWEILPRSRQKCSGVLLITVLFALASLAIEYTQYRFGLGLAETDDVIHNTLGALLGAAVCRLPMLPWQTVLSKRETSN